MSEPTRRAAVSVCNVVKDFGAGQRALDDVSVEFNDGSITALLGLSGSGKSTLLRHLNGMQTPSSGSVTVLGQELSGLTPRQSRELRRDIGMIFQSFALVGPMSVLENVCSGALGRLRGPRFSLFMYPKDVKREAYQHLERVGLAARAMQRADTLSGGQQQRVAIARSLMQRPRILLADEPVASLDPVSSAQIVDLLRDLHRDEGITIIAALHQVELALEFADRVVGLRGGRVVLDRPTAGLTPGDASTIYRSVSVDNIEASA